MKKLIATLLLATALAACGGENGNTAANKPQPQVISDAAKGYYCTMNLPEHNGPKAQIFLESKPDEALVRRLAWQAGLNGDTGLDEKTGMPKKPTK